MTLGHLLRKKWLNVQSSLYLEIQIMQNLKNVVFQNHSDEIMSVEAMKI